MSSMRVCSLMSVTIRSKHRFTSLLYSNPSAYWEYSEWTPAAAGRSSVGKGEQGRYDQESIGDWSHQLKDWLHLTCTLLHNLVNSLTWITNSWMVYLSSNTNLKTYWGHSQCLRSSIESWLILSVARFFSCVINHVICQVGSVEVSEMIFFRCSWPHPGASRIFNMLYRFWSHCQNCQP
jgi:hypothetical protein